MKARGAELAWASGSLATGAVYNAMLLFGLFYMTSVLGIGAGLAGSLLFLVRLYDAVTDPLMGTISDRTRHRLGPRRPYLAAGAIALGLSFALFFNLPALEPGPMRIALVAALVLYSTSYTVFAVPYLAMSPDIAPDYDSRTRLMAARVVFLILGVLLGSTGGPALVAAAGDGRAGYSVLGLALGALAVVGGMVAFFGTRSVVSAMPARPASTGSWRREAGRALAQIGSVFRLAPFRLLTLVKLLQLAVLALALACTPYFFRFVLERSTGDIGLYMLTFSLCGLASVPLWRVLIGRYGKRVVYLASIVLYGLGLCTWMLWQPGESDVFFFARAVGLGIVSNGTLLCALALLPDTMEYDRLRSGENRQGIMSGIFTTVEKIAGALGPLIIGVMLDAMGFVSGAEASAQPASALLAVKLGISVVPAVFCFAAIPLLLAYRLNPDDLATARKAAAAT